MSVMALSHQDASKIGSFPSSEMLAFWADTIFWHQRSYMEALLVAAREVDQLRTIHAKSHLMGWLQGRCEWRLQSRANTV